MNSKNRALKGNLTGAVQQAVVRAIGVEGAEISETAEKLGLSNGAVRVAFHRGLAALKRRLQGSDEI